MTNEELLQSFPTRRPRAVDGMAVTAETWETAHDYHRQHQRFHNLLAHGWGILVGLEVTASDPPDRSVCISPGVAIDPLGRLIVLAQPMTYDVGETRGQLYVLLSYGESRPRAADQAGSEVGLSFVHTEFGLEATPRPSDAPAVELARVRRTDSAAAIQAARDPDRPAMNELDVRFRRQVGPAAPEAASAAVVQAGGDAPEHVRGVFSLARSLRHTAGVRLGVMEGVTLDADLSPYALVCLVGRGELKLGPAQLERLREYVQAGGVIFLEACRHGGAAAPADAAGVASALGVSLDEVGPGHRLLTMPHLFPAVPAAYAAGGAPPVLAGDGLVVSSGDYACLWQGERGGGTATREEVRSALEWGQNLVDYALARLRASPDAGKVGGLPRR